MTSVPAFEIQRGVDGIWVRMREQKLPDGSTFIGHTDVTSEKMRAEELAPGPEARGRRQADCRRRARLQQSPDRRDRQSGFPVGRAARRQQAVSVRAHGHDRCRPRRAAGAAAPVVRAQAAAGARTRRISARSSAAWPTCCAPPSGRAWSWRPSSTISCGCAKSMPISSNTRLLNLATNARDAMPDGGRFTVTASNLRVDGAVHGAPGRGRGRRLCRHRRRSTPAPA